MSGPVSFATYKLLLHHTTLFPLPVFDLAKSVTKKTSAYGGSIQGSKCLKPTRLVGSN